MTLEKAQDVMLKYLKILDAHSPIRADTKTQRLPTSNAPDCSLCHVKWMLVQMDDMIKLEMAVDYLSELPSISGVRASGKLNRWLGFVQGVLYREGVFSIDEMREHNRP